MVSLCRTLGTTWVPEHSRIFAGSWRRFMYISRTIIMSFIFVIFIFHRENVRVWRNIVVHFGILGKPCTMSNICTAFLKLDMIVWSNCVFNFVSLHALNSREHRKKFLSTCLIYNNHVNYMKRGASVTYIYYSIVGEIHNYLNVFLLHNIYLSLFLVIRSLRNKPTRPKSRNNYPNLRYAFLG